MKCFGQVWTVTFSVFGVVLLLLTAGPVGGDEISDACNDGLSDITNILRACDVVIGRQETDRATRIRAFQVRARTHLAAGNIAAALADFSTAISALPDGKLKGYVLFLRAQSRFDYTPHSLQSITDSLNDLERANGLAPANPRILETLARLYQATGRNQQAIKSTDEALFYDPRSISARKTRAQLYEADGLTREALEDLNVLVERQLANPDLLTWRGRLHEKRRNLKQALADYRNAARVKTTQEVLDGIQRVERVLGVDK